MRFFDRVRDLLRPQKETPSCGTLLMRELTDRMGDDVSRRLTPAKLDRIISDADAGDSADQAELSQLILEKNDTAAHAFEVRRNALLGLKYKVTPQDDSPRAKMAAEEFEKALKEAGSDGSDSFRSTLADLMTAVISGYAVSEIVWGAGGTLRGFAAVPARTIDFTNSFDPRLRLSDTGECIALRPDKFLYAQSRIHGFDPVRGGLIRPLGYLHCFMRMNTQNLLSYIERFGMPMIVARASDSEFERQYSQLLRMLRNFGPNGGGLVSHGTEITPIQASDTKGEVYFSALEYFKGGIQRLILGQTASSSGGGGLSKDNAQSQVRQDILEADAEFLAGVINTQLIPAWTRFNFGDTPRPFFAFDVAPPDDLNGLADTLAKLKTAGLEPDPAEMTEKFGYTLRRADSSGGSAPVPAPDATPDADAAHNLNLKQKYDAMGVAIRAGLLTATPEIEAQTRAELNLPAMTPEVQKAWEATGGIRQPITLKTAEAAAVNEALDVKDGGKAELAEEGASPPPRVSAAEKQWLGPVAAALSDLSALSDEEFVKRLDALAENPPFGDSSVVERNLEEAIYTSMALGIADGFGRIRGKFKKREKP